MFLWLLIASTDVDPIDVRASAIDAEATATEVVSRKSTAAEALRGTPGTMVRALGGPFDFATLSIRGSSSTQVGIYVDGVSLTTASVGTVDLSTLALFDIEQLTLYRGLAPAWLGPDAFLGALHIKRKTTKGATASISVGSFAARQLVLSLADDAFGWTWQLSALYAGKRGDFTYYDNNGTPLEPSDDSEQPRRNNDLDAMDVRLEASRQQTRFQAALFAKEQGAPAPSSNSQTTARYQLIRPTLQFIHPYVSVTAVANLARFTSLVTNLYAPSTEQSTSDVEVRATSRYVLAPTEWLTLTFAGNASHARFDANALGQPMQQRQRTMLGAAAQVSARYAILEVEAQSRADGIFDTGTIAPNLFSPADLTPLDTRRFWLQPTLGVKVDTPVVFFAHIGARSRPPSFYELFGSNGQVRGNPLLKQERQWSWDVGATYTHPYITAEATYAEARLEDVIVFTQSGSALPQAQNIGRATTRHVELSARTHPWRYAQLQATYNFQHTQLPGRPGHQAKADLSLFWPKRARLMYSFYYIGQLFLDAQGSHLAPPRWPNDISLTVRVADFFLTAQMQNIFDQRTATVATRNGQITVQTVDVLGYPLPGRSVFFTLTYAFGDRAKALGETLCATFC